MDLVKQSTAVVIKFGPFVDSTDGTTSEAGLTISQADIRLSKNGGTFAQSNNAAGATHDEGGYYGVPLDATDTGTVGRLRVAVREAGALPVWQDLLVVPAVVYDSIVAGTDRLTVDVEEIGPNIITAAAIADAAIDIATFAADVKTGSYINAQVKAQDNIDFGALQKASLNAATPASVVGAVGSVTGAVGSVTGSVGSVAADVGITQAAADKVWGSAARTLTSFGTLVADIWGALLTGITTVGSIGKLIKDYLDAAVSTRSTYAGGDTSGTTTLLTRVVGTLAAGTHTAQTGDSFARLGAPAGASVSADIAAVAAKTVNLPASPAAVGSAMTLTTGERDSVAAALLDLANGVETSLTPRQALRIIASALTGTLSGADTTEVTIKGAGIATTRIVATVDANGNRSAVTLTTG